MNAPAEVIAELRDLQAREDFEVWPENWPAMEMFFRVQTQWRATYGSYYGLDYNAVFRMFDLYEVADQQAMIERLQVLERGVLAALNEDK